MACRPRFKAISQNVYEHEACGSAGFSKHYQMTSPQATEEDTATYVVRQWQKISQQLGIPVPYHELTHLLASNPKIVQQAIHRGVISDVRAE